MPTEKDRILRFTKHNFRNRIPFVIYADFEAINKPINDDPEKTTRNLKHNIAASVGYYILSDHPDITPSYYSWYRNPDVVERFCDFLIHKEKEFADILELDIPLNM
jgi:hypothetical protein